MAWPIDVTASADLDADREVRRVLDALEAQLGPAKRTQAYRAFAGEIRKEVRRRVPRSRGPRGARHLRSTTKAVVVDRRPRVTVGATPREPWAWYGLIVHQGRRAPTRREPVPFMAEGVAAGWGAGVRALDRKAQQVVAKANRRVNVRPISPGKLATAGRAPDWRRGDYDILFGQPKGRAAKKVRRK